MPSDLPDKPNKPVTPAQLAQARERAIEALTDLFAEDRISMDEFEGRLDRLYKASTLQELDELAVAPGRTAERQQGALTADSVFDPTPIVRGPLELVRP